MARSMATDWFDAWASGWRAAFSAGETAVAAATVVGSRMTLIGAAMRDPLSGDYAELTGMVTEKTVAFTQAGLALARDMAAIQREGGVAMMRYGAMIARGETPDMGDVAAMTSRSARIARRAAGSAERVLAPLHAKATANARRLTKRS